MFDRQAIASCEGHSLHDRLAVCEKSLTKAAWSGGSHNESQEPPLRATSELSRPSRRSAPSAWRRTGGWLLPVLAAAIIFAPPFAPTAEAQTTLVSNVGQTRSGSLGLDTHEGAQAFTTGDNSAGYTVTSVGLDMSSGADHTINFTVGILTNSNSNLPGSSLVTLTQPASLILGVNEFTTSGIELAANTTYWVVVDSNGGGSAGWEGTASDSEDPTSSGWSIADESYDRPYDGDTWGSYTDPFKFRVNGTAIGSITNNAPTFTEGTNTTRSVAENTASGQNIGAAVTATDADTSDTLTYTWGGTDASSFSVNNSTGQLRTSAALDYETQASYAVTVSVSDGNGGADSINVTINVTNVDEPNSAPVFTEGPSTTRSVAENTVSGQNIGAAVTATDAAALVTLYNATAGANWTNNTNWLSNEALSEWHGVDTDATGRVTELHLDGNKLSGAIPAELGDLTNLQILDLCGNELSGAIPAELGDLTNLQILELYDTDLSGAIPAELGNLTNLQILYLWGNGLSGAIPAELGNLTSLQELYLWGNELSGAIPAELGDLTNLQILHLYDNELSGAIPAELGNLTNLQILYLWSNELSGAIPAELGNLTSLQELYLWGNELSGAIPVELGDLTNLQILHLYGNELSGAIPAELGDLTSLQELHLWSNELSGAIPAELGNLTSLQKLELHVNELSGAIPAELGNLTNLQILYLHDNGLSGAIPVELGALTNLQRLYLYGNELSGTIPVELGDLTNLVGLYLNQNGLSGTIPAELGNLTSLQILYLWGNELSGAIPAELGSLTNLQRLYLYGNELSGAIPVELGALTNLQILYLWGNELSGTIPVELGNLTNLQELGLSRNELSGTIPAELGSLTNLQGLGLSRNGLSGTIPVELGALTNLQRLYLWGNELSGAIPVELGNLTNLQELYLNQNELSGPLPLTLSALSQLSVLDIRSTTLCAPLDAAFQAWLATINFQGAVCATPPPPPRPPGDGFGGGGGGGRTTSPGKPRNLTAVSGDGQVVLSWEAPVRDGGAEISDYEYRIDRMNPWISTSSTDTTHTVSGLVNGATYVFEVRAVNRAGMSFASNRVEATPEAPEPEVSTLDFAHFANGEGITSEVVLVNVGTTQIQPVLYFSDREGEPLAADSVVDLTDDLEVQEDGGLTIQTAMEPLGERTISTHGRGEELSGSVQVVSEGAIGGVLRFSDPRVGVTGVGTGPAVRDALFPARRKEGGIRTAAAMHNVGEEEMEVTCRLMSGGAVLEEAKIPLKANGQTSWFIEDEFTMTDTTDFVGTVRCTAPREGKYTGLAVEVDGGNRIFTTLPVVEVERTSGEEGETELDFAHFANGTGIVSELVFVNVETRPSGRGATPFHPTVPESRPVIYFYDREGYLIDPASVVDLTEDLEVTEDGGLTIKAAMAPLGELTVATHGRGPLVSGAVKVVSEGPIGGVLRYSVPGVGVTGVGAGTPVRDALFPARRKEGGIRTAAAMHNVGEEEMEVTCRLMSGGAVLEEAKIPLEAKGQMSWFIEDEFTATDTTDFVGTVRCTAPGEGMFTGLAVEVDAANRIFTTLPVAPVEERMPQE